MVSRDPLEDRVRQLEALVRQLQPEIPRFGPRDFQRQLRPMRTGEATFQEGLLTGALVVQRGTEARSDTAAADGEINVYTSGATVIMQVFDKDAGDAGEWRSTTLS